MPGELLWSLSHYEKNGEMAAELAADIRRLWAEWSVSPDVTGQYTRPVLERLLLRDLAAGW